MWWLAIPVAVGVAAYLIDELNEEVGDVRQRWENKKEEVERDLNWHKQNIENHLQQAKNDCDFYELVNVHYSSVKVADEAYKLLMGARDSINAVGQALGKAKRERDNLKKQRSKTAKEVNSRPEVKRKISDSVKTTILILKIERNDLK